MPVCVVNVEGGPDGMGRNGEGGVSEDDVPLRWSGEDGVGTGRRWKAWKSLGEDFMVGCVALTGWRVVRVRALRAFGA